MVKDLLNDNSRIWQSFVMIGTISFIAIGELRNMSMVDWEGRTRKRMAFESADRVEIRISLNVFSWGNSSYIVRSFFCVKSIWKAAAVLFAVLAVTFVNRFE